MCNNMDKQAGQILGFYFLNWGKCCIFPILEDLSSLGLKCLNMEAKNFKYDITKYFPSIEGF